MSESITSPKRLPSASEARLFARGLELHISAEVMVGIIDPEILPECLPDVADLWLRNPTVRAHRFDVRAWMEETDLGRQVQALSRVYNGIAWFCVMTDPVTATGAVQEKLLKYVAVLERNVGAQKQAPLDEAAKFWSQLQAGKVPNGGGRETRVGIADLRQ